MSITFDQRVLSGCALCALATIAAATMGVVSLHAVGPVAPWLSSLWSKQIVWLLVGTMAAAAVVAVPTEWLRRAAYPALAITILACVAAVIVGPSYGGLRRWLSAGPLALIPAEFAKLAMVLAIARFGDGLPCGKVSTFKDHLFVVAALLATIVPMILQPHLGAALVVVVVLLAVAFTLRWRIWVAVIAGTVSLLALPVTWHFGLHAYQKARVLAFFDPHRDPLGAGYQAHEMTTAVGAGGWLGQGVGSWAQSTDRPLANVAMELPFVVWAHEQGVVGSTLWLAAHAVIVLFAVWATSRAATRFHAMIGAGVASLWLVHVALSVGASLGLLPVVAVALPLGTYGGSNVVVSMVAVGLAMHVALRAARGPDATDPARAARSAP